MGKTDWEKLVEGRVYLSTRLFANRHDRSERTIRAYARDGRISGVSVVVLVDASEGLGEETYYILIPASTNFDALEIPQRGKHSHGREADGGESSTLETWREIVSRMGGIEFNSTERFGRKYRKTGSAILKYARNGIIPNVAIMRAKDNPTQQRGSMFVLIPASTNLNDLDLPKVGNPNLNKDLVKA